MRSFHAIGTRLTQFAQLTVVLSVLLLIPAMASAYPIRSMRIDAPGPGKVGDATVGYIEVTFSQTAKQAARNQVQILFSSYLEEDHFIDKGQGDQPTALTFNFGSNQIPLDASRLRLVSSTQKKTDFAAGTNTITPNGGSLGNYDLGFGWEKHVLKGGTSIQVVLEYKDKKTGHALSVDDFFHSARERKDSQDTSPLFYAAAHIQGLDKKQYGKGSTWFVATPFIPEATVLAVPEPSSLAIAGLSGLAFLGYGLRRRTMTRV